jgi:hypothetical protein
MIESRRLKRTGGGGFKPVATKDKPRSGVSTFRALTLGGSRCTTRLSFLCGLPRFWRAGFSAFEVGRLQHKRRASLGSETWGSTRSRCNLRACTGSASTTFCRSRASACLCGSSFPRFPGTNAHGNIPENFDLRSELHRATGVDLTAIASINVLTAQTVVAEVGSDMNRFPAEAQFASFLDLAPAE